MSAERARARARARANLLEVLAAMVIREQDLYGLDSVFVSESELEEVRQMMKSGKSLVVDTETAPGMTRLTMMTEDDEKKHRARLDGGDECL